MTKYYKEFLITAEPFITDIITSVLWNLDIDGINEEVNCIKIFSKNLNLSQTDIENELNKLIENNLLRSYDIQENILTEINWNEEWEKSREVIRVSDRIVIKPSFKDYKTRENEIVITLDPKMSFGTGEHPTTKLCINAIEKHIHPKVKVLDVGSGTAILSIVAAKLGADKVLAFDIDEWSLENGLENVRINNVESKVQIKQCEINEIDDCDFDLIVANIQRNILMELATQINNKIKRDGIVILSGLLKSDEQSIIDIYLNIGFETLEINSLEEWICIVMKKL
jgi:ribosomal protein L11 methyltransferase